MRIEKQSGYTLVEMLVAVGIGSIIALGVAALLVYMFDTQNKKMIEATLLEKANQIRAVMSNKQALRNTIFSANNPNMACLQAQISCTTPASCATAVQCSSTFKNVKYSPTDDRIVLWGPDAAAVNPFLDGKATNIKGFTDRGAVCNNFSYNMATGHDDCPIGYIVTWYQTTTGTTQGNTIVLTAKMVYNPSDTNKLKKLINSSSTDTMLSRYDVSVSHTLESIVDLSDPKKCYQDGVALYEGASADFYTVAVAPLGGTCPAAEKRTCKKDPATGNYVLSGSAPFSKCVQNCYGTWSICPVPCDNTSKKYFTMTVPGNSWGNKNCPTGLAAEVSCGCPAPTACVGSWSPCSVGCWTSSMAAGVKTYHVISQAKNGGSETTCAPEGSTQGCWSNQCSNPVQDCAGTWSACSAACGPGTMTFSVTQFPSGGGAPCPASPSACEVTTCVNNCVGNWGAWGACSATCGGGYQTRTYTVTTMPTPGGTLCTHNTGDQESQACNTGPCPYADGACGSAHNSNQPSAPASNLCDAGTPSAVTWGAPGKWSWSCAGTSTTASCFANPTNSWSFCFIAGTQVTLKNGQSKNIEDVQIGEEVLTFDEVSRNYIYRPVSKVDHHESKKSRLYKFHYDNRDVTSNDEHRYYLAREDRYASAAEIFKSWSRGQNIYFLNEKNEEVLVTKIETYEDEVPLFNLHVDGLYDQTSLLRSSEYKLANHNYFANGILVHNVKQCGGMSPDGNYKAGATSCNPGAPVYCDLTSNIMVCNFQSAANKATFDACMAAYGPHCP